jgi:hypothetical protein
MPNCLSYTIIIILFFLRIAGEKVTGQQFVSPFSKIKDEKEFIYGLDNRRTHIQRQNTLIYGGYLGISSGRNLRLKIGLSGTPFERGSYINSQGLTQRNRFFYFHIGEEFDFFEWGKFSTTAYLQLGYGANYYRKENEFGETFQTGKHNFVPIETGLHFNYDVYDWMRLKVGGGWRFILPEKVYYLEGYYIKLGIGISGKRLFQAYQRRKTEKNNKETSLTD